MFPEQVHVVIAVENPALRQELRDSLATTGFSLEECASAAEATKLVREHSYNSVLLGLGPRDSGTLDACRKLRAMAPRVGILIVRDGGAPEDEVRALEAGADDCVVPPFRFREIVARVGAVLRRSHLSASEETTALRAGELAVDVHRRLCWRSGTRIHLSPKEFDLLVFLMRNREVPLPHTRLLHTVWGQDTQLGRAYLRQYVKALRKKLEDDPLHPAYILTEPWVGYRFHNPNPSPARP